VRVCVHVCLLAVDVLVTVCHVSLGSVPSVLSV